MPAFISSIVGVGVSLGIFSLLAIELKTSVLVSVLSSISDKSFANIGKLVLLSELATRTVFSLFTIEVFPTLVLELVKRLLYISLAPNCIFTQEAFIFFVAWVLFFVSFSSTFSFLISVTISFCFSTSCIILVSENALVPFIKKSTASPTEYFTFSYLFASDRRVFSVFSKLLFPILSSPINFLKLDNLNFYNVINLFLNQFEYRWFCYTIYYNYTFIKHFCQWY